MPHRPQVFGDAIIRQLNSEKWDQREEALQSISERLRQEANVAAEMSDRLPLFNACCCIVRSAMNDKVAPVYFASCKLLEYLVDEFGKELNAEDVQAGLAPLMGSMLARTGESNQRVLECTCALFLSLARMETVGLDFIATYVTQQIKTMRKTRLVWGRLDLVRRTIIEYGLKRANKFSADTVLPMVIPALEVADEKVRKMAMRVVVDTYKIVGKDAVNPHVQNCKPALQNSLQRRFDKADGKPTQPKQSATRLAPLKPLKGAGSLPPLQMEGVSLKGGPPKRSSLAPLAAPPSQLSAGLPASHFVSAKTHDDSWFFLGGYGSNATVTSTRLHQDLSRPILTKVFCPRTPVHPYVLFFSLPPALALRYRVSRSKNCARSTSSFCFRFFTSPCDAS